MIDTKLSLLKTYLDRLITEYEVFLGRKLLDTDILKTKMLCNSNPGVINYVQHSRCNRTGGCEWR